MSDVRFDVQWQEADEVSTKELAATWARFSLYVGDECLSVVEDSLADSYRSTVDVAMYPLAEWIAFNWWFLTTPNAGRAGIAHTGDRTTRERHCMAAAGDGFPWPPLFLFPEDGGFLASQTPIRNTLQRVNFVRSGRYVLDFESTVYTLERFVDSVVRRLEDSGVRESRLQREWDLVQSAPTDEGEFCRAAAVVGQNPYAIEEAISEALVDADSSVDNSELLLQMLPAINLSQLDQSVDWLIASLRVLGSERSVLTSDELLRITKGVGHTLVARDFISAARPWQAGYERARIVRETMNLVSSQLLDLDDLVALEQVDVLSPGALEALIQAERSTAVAVVSKQHNHDSTRFTQARTLSRAIFGASSSPQIVSRGTGIRDRAERAFAAELLAPARGIAEFLAGDLSEEARSEAALHFGVGQLVIEHQIDNQLTWDTQTL